MEMVCAPAAHIRTLPYVRAVWEDRGCGSTVVYGLGGLRPPPVMLAKASRAVRSANCTTGYRARRATCPGEFSCYNILRRWPAKQVTLRKPFEPMLDPRELESSRPCAFPPACRCEKP